MGQYRIAVCDDEQFYREEVTNLLKAYGNESNNNFEIDSYASGEELLFDYDEKLFHIIILDVEMKGKSGLDTAWDIRKKDEKVIILFATSFENYALGAFEVEAMGYLVKPVSYVKLKKLLLNAIIAVDFLRDSKVARERYIEVKVKYETVKIEVSKIKFIEKNRNTCVIHTVDDEYSCYETLSQLHDKLDIHKFCYVHQGYVVNYDMIKEVTNNTVVLADYIEVPISRRYYKEIKARFMEDIYRVMARSGL